MAGFWSTEFWATGFWADGFWAGSDTVDQIAIQLPKTRFREGSTFTAVAHFRKDKAAITPGTVHYRIDCLSTQKQIKGWTELDTSTTVDITITTFIKADWNRTERKQLTVLTDKDSENEFVGRIHWTVVNLLGIG